MSDWYDASDQTRVVGAWSGAPIENEENLTLILGVAREQVEAYGGPVVSGEDVPDRYILAQIRQAQNLWAAGRADENGDIGSEGYSYVPRPLDKTIRNIIRPVQGGIGGGF